MSLPPNESVLAKIQKLLALAGNNPNEHEAASAMAKAQELLVQHNLSMAHLDAHKEKKTKEEAAEGREQKGVKRSGMFIWQRELWKRLAEVNFCIYWSQKQYHASGVYSNHQHWLVGREDNVKTVEVMGDYLEEWMSKNCPYGPREGKNIHLWKQGVVDRLTTRLREKFIDMMVGSDEPKPAAESQAVTVRSVYQAEVHANHLFRRGTSDWCPCDPCSKKRRIEWDERQATMPVRVEKQEVAKVEKQETEAQRRARLEREARQQAKWEEKWRKEYEKQSSEAYKQGREDGDKPNLGGQIK
jgi:hypothetical protein